MGPHFQEHILSERDAKIRTLLNYVKFSADINKYNKYSEIFALCPK